MCGNIIGITKKQDITEGVFNTCLNFNERIKDIPTLIVGVENACKYIENFNILNTHYPDEVFWTFSKTERRKQYNEDIEKFKKYCLEKEMNKVTYEYLDFTCFTYSRFRNFVKYINSTDVKLCFLTRNSNFMFIYSPKYNYEWGLSLTFCEYIGISKHKIIKRFKSNSNNKFIYDLSFFDNLLKDLVRDNTHYILPLYYKIKMS